MESIEERYPLCINCSELKQQECAEYCSNYWKYKGAIEQKAIDDAEIRELKSLLEKEMQIG